MREAERLVCEFSLIRYVPDPVKDEFVNIGVLLREMVEPHRLGLRFTRDWRRVRCLDAGADVHAFEALETELRQRMTEGPQVLQQLQESFSTQLQITAPKGCLAETFLTQMEELMKMYVESYKLPREKTRTGRSAIHEEMRRQFEQGGVWGLLKTRIAAERYTRAGDPLRIDCGYRTNGTSKMFQAVSLIADVEAAKGLAYSASALREGVRRVEGAKLELAVFVEPIREVGEDKDLLEQYAFGRETMELQGIHVLTVTDLGRIVEAARLELHV